MKPTYKHDCPACTFLGADTLHDEAADVYVCPQGDSPTILLRFGDADPAYTSWNFFFFERDGDIPSPPKSYLLAKRYYAQAKEMIEESLSVERS